MDKNNLLQTLLTVDTRELRRLCDTVETLQTSQILQVCNDTLDCNNCDHGSTLDEVITAIRNQPYEIVAFFDKTGRKIFEHTDHSKDYAHTMLTPPQYEKATIGLHNHIDDATFSSIDLDIGPHFQLATNILVTPNLSYYLCRPEHGWPKGQEWLKEYQALSDNLYLTSKRNFSRYEARHEALLRVASHYDIHYYVNDLKGNTVYSNM